MFNNVLVGVDGRQGGRDAIALARNLAGPEADLTLAHVYASDWMLGRGGASAVEAEHLAAQALLERERSAVGADADAAAIGVRPVGQGLHELAEDRGADLLVVGSSRHALLGRVMMAMTPARRSTAPPARWPSRHATIRRRRIDSPRLAWAMTARQGARTR